eukprot:5994116-Amphidinium_carterae.2
MGDEAKKQYVTVTGEGLTIHGWKHVRLLVGRISLQVSFVVANVHSALLGLPDLNKNNVTFHTGVIPYIEKYSATTGHKTWEPLRSRGAHIHAAAIVLDGFYKPHNIYLDSDFNSRYNPSLPTTVLVGEVEEVSQQADIPRQLRQPPQLTKKEQEEHRLTHMPYRPWCPICVKSKGQPVHHRRGGLKEQSVLH